MNKETLIYVVDSQRVFMDQTQGKLYVPGAEEIKGNLVTLAEVARENKARRAFSRDRHFPDDLELTENGGPFHRHGMDYRYDLPNADGSYDMDFIPELKVIRPLMLADKTNVGFFATYSPEELTIMAASRRDLILEKQTYDIFSNPWVQPLFEEMKRRGLRRVILGGVATEYCDLAVVLGLRQKLDLETYVVEDAISGMTPEGIKLALEQMQQVGSKVIRLSAVSALLENKFREGMYG